MSLVADRPPTRVKGVVLARYGSQLLLSNEPTRAREMTQAALEIAEALGDDDMRAQALLSRGQSRLILGDPDGLEDMERARQLALESNSLETAERVLGNLADSYASHRANLARCFQLQAEARRVVDRIGTTAFRYFFAGERVTELYVRGDWDEASALGGKVADELSRHPNPHFIQVPTRSVLARIASGRGDEERAESESAIALELGRAIGDLQVLYSALESRAVVLLDSGRQEEARAVVDEYLAHETSEFERTGIPYLPWEARLGLVWMCVHHGYGAQLERMLDAAPRWQIHSPWRDMMKSIFAGDLRSAAAMAESHLLLADAAFLRLKGGVDVERALAFYREAGAPRYVKEAEKLVAA